MLHFACKFFFLFVLIQDATYIRGMFFKFNLAIKKYELTENNIFLPTVYLDLTCIFKVKKKDCGICHIVTQIFLYLPRRSHLPARRDAPWRHAEAWNTPSGILKAINDCVQSKHWQFWNKSLKNSVIVNLCRTVNSLAASSLQQRLTCARVYLHYGRRFDLHSIFCPVPEHYPHSKNFPCFLTTSS